MTDTQLIDKLVALGATQWPGRASRALSAGPTFALATESQLRALVDAETEECRAQRDRLLAELKGCAWALGWHATHNKSGPDDSQRISRANALIAELENPK